MNVPLLETTNPTAAITPTARIAAAFDRIAEVDRPEIWITLRSRTDVDADASAVEQRLARGEDLPLAGVVVAVKDNIDVAGMLTTAACPEYGYTPEQSATAVRRLIDAGAIVLGKTNLDQFATGLVGTRSPYGPVRNALDENLVSGGSSSGSAVAVALGIADIALGTDTAGSGRVPAALNGIVGIKPTLGLISNTGVVPACIDYDTITVFARTLPEATTALAALIGPDTADPRSRTFPADTSMAAPKQPRLAIPLPDQLSVLSDEYRTAWDATIEAISANGIVTEPVDLTALLDAALLLYDGAIVAERYSAVGEFIDVDPNRDGLDPTVTAIIRAAGHKNAADFVNDLDALRRAQAHARSILDRYDGLLLPTTTEHPSIDAVKADPVAINRRMGTYTNFCNLLDLTAVAVPGTDTHTGLPFGVMVVAPAFADQVALDLANRIAATTASTTSGDVALPTHTTGAVPLAVFGAHREGAPLHHELTAIAARYAGEIDTTDDYRLYALNTTPPKPGLIRVAEGTGEQIHGELYDLSPAGLGKFLAALPAPMSLTAITLADGRTVTGFSCTHDATEDATDITEHKDWLRYLADGELPRRGTGMARAAED